MKFLSAYLRFQSTLPLRGATLAYGNQAKTATISIHTPLAGSDVVDGVRRERACISIHTPLAGSDFVGVVPECMRTLVGGRSLA